MEAAGRGPTAIRRCIATLSSATRSARRQNRITNNPTADTALPAVTKAVLTPWSADEAVRFLDHVTDDGLGPVFEVMVGCGLRRGEALALRWCDVDLDAREVAVVRTLSDVDGKLVFSPPKTRSSEDVVGLPGRVVAALRVQQMRQQLDKSEWQDSYRDEGLVFARPTGSRFGRTTCPSGSCGCATRPGCPASGCTTCGTPARRCCSPTACRSPWC